MALHERCVVIVIWRNSMRTPRPTEEKEQNRKREKSPLKKFSQCVFATAVRDSLLVPNVNELLRIALIFRIDLLSFRMMDHSPYEILVVTTR
jgi:hypothetical protein